LSSDADYQTPPTAAQPFQLTIAIAGRLFNFAPDLLYPAVDSRVIAAAYQRRGFCPTTRRHELLQRDALQLQSDFFRDHLLWSVSQCLPALPCVDLEARGLDRAAL
jgi:hypothetical protein